jgi:glycosyltransferase involved in cell wall biosynthesis
MRILALTRYERLGSSSRVRFYQYFPYLQSQGLNITSASFFNDEYVRRIYAGRRIGAAMIFIAYIKRLLVLFRSMQYDLLWIEKELFPYLPAWSEQLLAFFKIPYVVDYDDAVFHRYDMHKSAIVRRFLGHKIDNVMRRAALVIAGNEYLAERARQAGAKRVEYLPSVVDVNSYAEPKGPAGTSFRIGWIGSPVTAPYLSHLREALTRLSHETDIHVTVIGAENETPFPEVPTTRLAWNETIERSLGEMFDVGIMPLVDGPFERGKCGYKLVQYMAGGIPVIASPVGINQNIVEPGVNGYLAASTEEWLTAFQNLIRHEDLRSRLGKAGRKKAEEMYNLHITGPKLLQLLSSVQKG